MTIFRLHFAGQIIATRAHPRLSGISATADGRVFSVRAGTVREVARTKDRLGYRNVWLRQRSISVHVGVRAHVVVWECFNGDIPDGYEIDHINRDASDNHLVNLRLATRSQNLANRAPYGSSGVKGASINRFGKYEAKICGKYIGTYTTPSAAAAAYDRAATGKFGQFALTNKRAV